jgi:hypothetical protein
LKNDFANRVNCWDISLETISSEASKEERSTTIPKGSRAKWLEAHGIRKDDDMVYSAWRHAAAKAGRELTNSVEYKALRIYRSWTMQSGAFDACRMV